ncbi:MAG: ATP-binding protein, partial [Bacteroidaceae bacterium]|nr:ATP-binding protein [Bacteroidaceae bacterium]
MRDFSLQYATEKLSGEERRMAEEINAVIREFREVEHRRVGESHFYDALLSTVESILLASDEKGNVRWMNEAAISRLLGFRFERIEALAALEPNLPQLLRTLRKGESQLVAYSLPNGEERQFVATMTPFFTKGFVYRLYNLQRVDSVLQQSEVMAQNKLISVLTHEIMNSLTPIISLSDTLKEGIGHPDPRLRVSEEDEKMAVEAINRRASGLMQFVQNYRKISGIGMPEIMKVGVGDLFESLQKLLSTEMKDLKVDINVSCANETVSIDRSQIEQVLINLLKNAAESGGEKIELTAQLSSDNRWIVIAVKDDGGGILPEAMERLFTPFFTTKPGGQGIGLAVCRQIVSKHGGTISAKSMPDVNGSVFTVRLPL